MTSSLYTESTPSVTLKPCPLTREQFEAEINRSVPGQGRRYGLLRKQFLAGGTNRRYSKYEAAVKLSRSKKKVYATYQRKTSQQGVGTMRPVQPGPTDDHQTRIPTQGIGGLDIEGRLFLLHNAANRAYTG